MVCNSIIAATQQLNPAALTRLSSALALVVFASYSPVNLAADNELTINLVGTVEPRCELGNLERETTELLADTKRRISFGLYCNTDMSITLESTHGGLVNTNALANTPVTEDTFWRYTATLRIDSIAFEKQLNSAEMVGGTTFPVEGGVVFDTTGSLELELDDRQQDGQAGTYSDEIKISIFPTLAAFN